MKRNILILFLLFIASIGYGQRAITQQIIGPPTLQFVTDAGNVTTLGASFGDTVSGSDPIVDQNFVTKAYGDANYSGGSLWTADGNGITYSSGNVGIGAASNASYALWIDASTGNGAIAALSDDASISAITANYSSASGTAHAGSFLSTSTGAGTSGVSGSVSAGGSGSAGIKGVSNSTTTDPHYAGYFEATAGSQSYGVYAEGNTAAFRVSFDTAPSSASDTGTTGEIRITTTHIYVCTATDTWVRTAITTW